MGSRSADVPSAKEAPQAKTIPSVGPSQTFSNADYSSGGVALRNRSEGVMQISGVTGTVQGATLYFAYLFVKTPPNALRIRLKRLSPSPIANLNVKALLIGTSSDPCWGSSGGAVYSASVPTSFATGNGEYQVFVPASVLGATTGGDPWTSSTIYPLDEGASLVLVGSGAATVDIYDTHFAGVEFGAPLSYTLNLSSATNGSPVLMDSIGADGQIGFSRADSGVGPDEAVTVNGVQISGGNNTLNQDSDWDGSSGFPLPQLWDDVGHDITSAAPSGTTSLNVAIGTHWDCLVTVANVVQH
jgi:hypothetical protein